MTMDKAKRGRSRLPKNPSSASSSIKDPEFFEVFLPDRVSHQLLIPQYFDKHFQRSIREKVILSDLSGQVWLVDLKQEKDGVYLKKGWNQFVNDKSLELGEFLVFRYNEISGFTVRTFALSSCKKEEFKNFVKTETTKASEVARPEFLNSEEYPQFFKIYMPHLCSKQLRIPPAFVKYFKGVLPSNSLLMTSANKYCKVNVEKVDGYLCFHHGWEEFVKDYFLELGDFLVFYYHGESRFFVSVFRKDNRPKQLTDGLSFDVQMSRTYVEKAFMSIPIKFIRSVMELKERAKLRVSGHTWEVNVTGYDTQGVKMTSGWSRFREENALRQGDVCCFKLAEIEGDFYVFNVSVTRSQGKESNVPGKEKKRSIVDSSFSFEITIQPSYLTRGFLMLPRPFYDGLKECYRGAAKLQYLGRTWEVKMSRYEMDRRFRFHSGWALFVEENCLRLGDICSFKMIDIEPEFYVMNVSFSRASQ